MVSEALIAANPVFHFEEVIHSPEQYLRLISDDLLHIIKKSKNADLKTSSDLLKRIDRRDLYKCVGESIISKEAKRSINASDIAACQDMNLAKGGAAGQLRPEDLIVHCFKVDWGSDELYPLDNMCFYRIGQFSQPELFSLPKHETN